MSLEIVRFILLYFVGELKIFRSEFETVYKAIWNVSKAKNFISKLESVKSFRSQLLGYFLSLQSPFKFSLFLRRKECHFTEADRRRTNKTWIIHAGQRALILSAGRWQVFRPTKSRI
jgi:hypothetical protein